MPFMEFTDRNGAIEQPRVPAFGHRIACSSLELCRRSVIAGVGVSCLPDFMVRADLEVGRLASIPMRGEAYPRPELIARMPERAIWAKETEAKLST